jgi:hypothetical protein
VPAFRTREVEFFDHVAHGNAHALPTHTDLHAVVS